MTALVQTERPRERGGCPECGGSVEADGLEAVCSDCGLVTDERRLDHAGGRHLGVDGDAAPRTATRHDRGLGGSVIGYRDANGQPVNSRRLGRLRKWQRRSVSGSKRERNRIYALIEVRRILAALDQDGGIVAQACRLAESAQDANLWLGRGTDEMAAAAVLAALRVNRRPFTLADIAPASKADESGIRTAYTAMNRELDLPTPPPTVAAQVPRVASAAGVPEAVESDALAVARAIDDDGHLGGRKPSGLAAGALYLIARRRGLNYTGLGSGQLADVTDVCATTIREAADAIEEAGLA